MQQHPLTLSSFSNEVRGLWQPHVLLACPVFMLAHVLACLLGCVCFAMGSNKQPALPLQSVHVCVCACACEGMTKREGSRRRSRGEMGRCVSTDDGDGRTRRGCGEQTHTHTHTQAQRSSNAQQTQQTRTRGNNSSSAATHTHTHAPREGHQPASIIQHALHPLIHPCSSGGGGSRERKRRVPCFACLAVSGCVSAHPPTVPVCVCVSPSIHTQVCKTEGSKQPPHTHTV